MKFLSLLSRVCRRIGLVNSASFFFLENSILDIHLSSNGDDRMTKELSSCSQQESARRAIKLAKLVLSDYTESYFPILGVNLTLNHAYHHCNVLVSCPSNLNLSIIY